MDIEKYYEPFQSERLLYRKLTLDDKENWIEFFYDNPNLKYLGINLERTAEEIAEEWIQNQLRRYQEKKFGLLGVFLKADQSLVAIIGFKVKESHESHEIIKATLIKPKYWRQGIGKEASLSIIGKAFANNLIDKIIGFRHVDNKSSEIFNKKLGLKDVGIFQEEARMVVKYEITKQEWIDEFGPYIS